MKLIEGLILSIVIILSVFGIALLNRDPYNPSVANRTGCTGSHYRVELYPNGTLKYEECWK